MTRYDYMWLRMTFDHEQEAVIAVYSKDHYDEFEGAHVQDVLQAYGKEGWQLINQTTAPAPKSCWPNCTHLHLTFMKKAQ